MLRSEEGAVLAEYAVVLITVTLVVAIAVASLGLPLFRHFVYAEALIGLPIP